MNGFKVYYLGVGSATPSLLHQPSCQVVDFRGRLFMVDCGEGAQLGMRRLKLKYSRIEHIFISHLHGDHIFGLPGLLSTMALHAVGGKVTVHLPSNGVDWLWNTMDKFCHQRSFELKIEAISPDGGMLYTDDSITIEAFPLKHRVQCTGFLFKSTPGLRHLKKDMVDWLNIPIKFRQPIKQGADYVTEDGRIFTNDQLTTPGNPSLSYAYCSDTIFNLNTAGYIRNVDVMFHEATYLEADSGKAVDRFHSTAKQAVRVAVAAGAKVLVLGHYSKTYKDTSGHLVEAEEEAKALGSDIRIIAANEGMEIDIETIISLTNRN